MDHALFLSFFFMGLLFFNEILEINSISILDYLVKNLTYYRKEICYYQVKE
jgi:hypothetical protein